MKQFQLFKRAFTAIVMLLDLENKSKYTISLFFVLLSINVGFTQIYLQGSSNKLKSIEILHGDINEDGSVNEEDVVILSNYIIGIKAQTFNNNIADVNKDNKINVSDIVIIKNKILNSTKDYIYLGGLEPEGDITEEMVKKLNKIEATKPLDVISFTYETGRMCYAYPTKWPEISSMTDPNGFGFIFDAQSNMIIDGIEYRVYYEPDGVDSQSDFKLNVKY